ncbi:MAG: porphobilinogen synthase [Alphaproteobacteria bacterium]|nr:porphobilinogen synthase [Alphaproteobacteria bacterium]
MASFPSTRLRRLRQSSAIRDLVKETRLHKNQLVYPLFIKEGISEPIPIASMPGYKQLSLNCLKEEIKEIEALGIKNIILFGIPALKDTQGLSACREDGIVQKAIQQIKILAPHLLLIVDLCFCQYTDHGHCGIINLHNGSIDVDNDLTLDMLKIQAISLAKAGADVIAPSGMMDGMVAAVREALDQEGYYHIPIISYGVKYASALYGPFRQATEGKYFAGSRKSYQMDLSNGQEALREAALDIGEGADILMVKPGHTYLDILYRIKQAFPSIPLAVYHTSGEYSMIKAAAEKGWIDEKQVILEVMSSFQRAGANIIITYFAKNVAQWLKEDN